MEKNRAGEERASMVQGWRHSLCMGKSELQHQISQGKSWIDTGACSFWSEMGWGLSRTWSRNCDELSHVDTGQVLLARKEQRLRVSWRQLAMQDPCSLLKHLDRVGELLNTLRRG